METPEKKPANKHTTSGRHEHPLPEEMHAAERKAAEKAHEQADHDIAEQSRHAEQEGGDAPDEAERAFDTLVHDNVVDVVAEIPRHGRGKGVGACREERQKQDRYADIGGRKYGSGKFFDHE